MLLGSRANPGPPAPTEAPAVRILLDPAEAQAEKDRRARHLHAFTFPIFRVVGMQLLIAVVLLHNAVVGSGLTLRDHLGFIVGIEAYATISWLILHLWYGRWRLIDLGYWVLYGDLAAFTAAVYATGGPDSVIFAILLIRVADQTPAGFRRMLLFAHLVPLVYLGLVLYMGLVEGRQFAWPIELAKPVFLYCFAIYLTTTAKAAEAVRDRLSAAIKVARESIIALKQNQRTLEEQSRQLEEARRRAENASQAKSAFLSRASHELRTPLNAVLGFAQLLELDRLPAKNREHVDQIVEGGAHLRALLDDLLDLTGIESGHLAPSTAPMSIGPVLVEACGLLRPAAARHGIRLDLDQASLNGRAVKGDRRRFKQVVLNLLSNAIKYNRRGGRVAVGCTPGADGSWRVTVTDTGHGIPRDKLDQLYRPFDRLGAEQTSIEGTGLGLALSRAFVLAMNGRMGVDSEPGVGSSFWFEIPAAASIPEDAADDVATARAAITGDADATVLYVEDHPANIALVEKIFARRPRTRLLTATTGTSGLTSARQEAPDVILLDLNLPDVSGREVLAALRAHPSTRGIPVIIVSADALPEHVDALLDAGAQAYVTKPFDVRHLLGTVDDMLAAAAPAA